MRPVTAVTLIILGSCFAISVSLAAVIIIVMVLGDEYPRLQREFHPLLSSLLIFVGLTAICALSFYALLKNHAARYWAQAAMLAGLLLTGWYYWP
jgi:cation transport ATPase